MASEGRWHARRRSRRRWLGVLLWPCLLLLAGCGDVVRLELPTVAQLDATPQPLRVPSVVVDADGNRLAELRREYREPVSLTQVPRHLVNAVLTAEDRRFYEHGGVDARSLTRAALTNLAAGEVEQGGSTITQQLVGVRYLPDAPRTMETKVHEALLARQLEAELPKATILEEYLNTVYFGEGAYGIGAAAETYFRTEVADLDVAQSALLAAIIRAPEAFAPTRAPEEARRRRDDVLFRMAADGYLTPAQRDAATATPIEVHGRVPTPATREPHVVDLVVRTLLADPGFGPDAEARADRLYGGGLVIHTTLQPAVQAAAREALATHLPDPDDPEAAIAAVDPRTGHVVAAVGNRAYEELQFDLATQARRQPGSTFKTFVLAAAITAGWHPDDRLDGRQGEIRTTSGGTWEVGNYDRRSYPSVTLAGATRASVNAAYARLGIEVGVPRVAALASAMGVRSPVPPDDAQVTIGGGRLGVTPLDLAAAYGTIGNLGVHVPTTIVSKIEDADGEVVWLPDTRGRPVLSPSAAYVTANVLRGVVEAGTGLRAQVDGWEVAGKTGTTSDHADAWFAGTTPVLSAAVWMGHVEGRVPMFGVQGVPRVTGGSLPAEMFASFLTTALADVEPVPFVLPRDHYRIVRIDPASGLLAAPWCSGEVVRVPLVLVPTETCPEPPPPPPPPSAVEPDDLEDGEVEEDPDAEADPDTEADAGEDGDPQDGGDEGDEGDEGDGGDGGGGPAGSDAEADDGEPEDGAGEAGGDPGGAGSGGEPGDAEAGDGAGDPGDDDGGEADGRA